MYRSNSTRIVPIIIVIVIIIALIAGLVTVGRYVFGGNTQGSQQASQQKAASDNLVAVDANRSVQMIVRGPIVADENFRSYEIDVSPSTRTYTVYQGYLDTVNSTQNFNNNTAAYTQFVYALNKAALTQTRTTNQSTDIRGVCATGNVYEFSIMNNGQTVDYYWTSTCSGSPGNFGASINQVTNLFVAQIPGLRNTFTVSTLRF